MRSREPVPAPFLDMQAEIGVTKHLGGTDATDTLLTLCHAGPDQRILDVGCGIGAGPSRVATRYGCRVTGVDVSERMVAWARRRAREDGVTDRVTIALADVRNLPFPDGTFDAVIAESVLIFVQDKARAIAECVRVTKEGGYVGLNEGFWSTPPPPELEASTLEAVGPHVPALPEWKALWDASGLEDRILRTAEIDPRSEVRSRIRWIGWRWLLRAWGRALRLVLTNASVRASIRRQLDVPSDVFRYLGYVLLVGRKPAV